MSPSVPSPWEGDRLLGEHRFQRVRGTRCCDTEDPIQASLPLHKKTILGKGPQQCRAGGCKKISHFSGQRFSYSFAPTRGHTASLTTQSLLLAWCPDADPKHLTGAAAGCGTASTTADRGHRETGRDPTMRGMQPRRR